MTATFPPPALLVAGTAGPAPAALRPLLAEASGLHAGPATGWWDRDRPWHPWTVAGRLPATAVAEVVQTWLGATPDARLGDWATTWVAAPAALSSREVHGLLARLTATSPTVAATDEVPAVALGPLLHATPSTRAVVVLDDLAAALDRAGHGQDARAATLAAHAWHRDVETLLRLAAAHPDRVLVADADEVAASPATVVAAARALQAAGPGSTPPADTSRPAAAPRTTTVVATCPRAAHIAARLGHPAPPGPTAGPAARLAAARLDLARRRHTAAINAVLAG